MKFDGSELTPAFPLYRETEEMSLLEYFMILVRYKWMLIIVVILSGLSAVVYSLQLTNIYHSEATIAPRESGKGGSALGVLGGIGGILAGQLGIGGNGSWERLEMVLKSRELSARVINKHELMPVLFADKWDPEKKIWIAKEPPTLQDGQHKIRTRLIIRNDIKKRSMSIGFEHKDPEIAKKLVGYYLLELSNSLREKVLWDAKENMRFFYQQLEETSDAFMREKIYALLAEEIEKETFAKAQKYYGFLVIDPPVAPDPDKRAKPNRRTICILTVLISFLGAAMLAGLIEMVKKARKENPEKFDQLMNELKLWRIKSSSHLNNARCPGIFAKDKF
jgi:uncharacterized protein involved in exopolysaccharide biosynthesis